MIFDYIFADFPLGVSAQDVPFGFTIQEPSAATYISRIFGLPKYWQLFSNSDSNDYQSYSIDAFAGFGNPIAGKIEVSFRALNSGYGGFIVELSRGSQDTLGFAYYPHFGILLIADSTNVGTGILQTAGDLFKFVIEQTVSGVVLSIVKNDVQVYTITKSVTIGGNSFSFYQEGNEIQIERILIDDGSAVPPEPPIVETQPQIIDPIDVILPPETYPNTNIAIPPSPVGAAPELLITYAAEFEDLSPDTLRGFDHIGYSMQRPKRSSGLSKLENGIWYIVNRVLLQNTLRIRLVASEQGLLAARIKRELENPANWWAGQETPIILEKIVITRRDIARIGGVAIQADSDGDLVVQVNYLERSTGIEVPRDGLSTLIIPFGAFDGGN
jgi:hypothetical protein